MHYLTRTIASAGVAGLALFLLPGPHPSLAGGNQPFSNVSADHGADLIRQVGCGSCHIIPGINMAEGLVGPPLIHFSRRIYIAGLLRNTPENLVTWLRNPQKIVPGNAMPDMGLSEEDAEAIANYLYTIN
ncbi:MAG TPA: c-type cytochrome [Pararhizobium sp.]|jgi:cytochrome c2|nr:c-type cytochrome [Pararhizobium sp.]